MGWARDANKVSHVSAMGVENCCDSPRSVFVLHTSTAKHTLHRRGTGAAQRARRTMPTET